MLGRIGEVERISEVLNSRNIDIAVDGDEKKYKLYFRFDLVGCLSFVGNKIKVKYYDGLVEFFDRDLDLENLDKLAHKVREKGLELVFKSIRFNL